MLNLCRMVVIEIELCSHVMAVRYRRSICENLVKQLNRYHICFYDNGLRLTVLQRRNMGLALHQLTGSNAYRLFFKSTPHRPSVVTVEWARWPVTPPPAICTETRYPGSYSRKQIVRTIEQQSYDLRRWYETT